MKAANLAGLSALLLLSAASIAPARTLYVGQGKTYAKPSAAARAAVSGDTIIINAGTYSSDEAVWRASNLVIRGTAKYAWITAPSTISNQKAIWVTQGSNIKVENIRFSGAAVPDRNGAGIRSEGNNLQVVNCYFHDNQAGLLSNNVATYDLYVERSHFARNGIGNGYTHNIYAGNIRTFTLKYSSVHHAKGGQNVKSRAATNHILYNRIVDSTDGRSNYEIDLPNGGNAYVIGNVIQQSPYSTNSIILSYGMEGMKYSNNGLSVVNNTFVNKRSSGTYIRFPSGYSPAKVINNLFVGPGTITSGPAESRANLSSSSPGFLSSSRYDFRLASSSIAVDKGVDPGTFAGISLVPGWQWSAASGGETRPPIGPLDVGAFEYSGSTP